MRGAARLTSGPRQRNGTGRVAQASCLWGKRASRPFQSRSRDRQDACATGERRLSPGSAKVRGVIQKPTLRIASSPPEAWEGAIAPWFREVLPVSWKQELPSVVAVPTRSHAHALKARLLQEGHSHLGLQFVTPAGLRDLLGGDRDHALPLREHLRLLLAIAAEETLRESAKDENGLDNLAAKAVVR